MTYAVGYQSGMDDTSRQAPNLNVLSFAKNYIRLMPGGMGKLSAILDIVGAGEATNLEHFWYTKTMLNPEAVLSANALVGATTLTVTSTATILPKQILQNLRTYEHVLVVSVDSATQLTVTRGVGTTAAAAMNSTDVLAGVGTAFEEGSFRPVEASISPARVPNYTQIFRNAWALTDSLRAIATIAGEGHVAENKRDCLEFHMRDQEAAIIFGERVAPGALTVNGKPFRKMDGIVNAVKTHAPGNVFTAGATTTYTQLLAMLDPPFNTQTDPRTANSRMLICGRQAVNVLHQIARLNSQYHIVNEPSPSAQNFGINFKTFTTPRGTFELMEHPMLNFHTEWSKMAIAVDISQWRKMYLGDRKMKAEEYRAGGQTSSNGLTTTGVGVSTGQDAQGGSVTSEFTLEYKNPASSGVIYNLTAGAAG